MATLIVRTQAEFDALPAKFDEWTRIEIRATSRIVVNVKRENSSVVAWGNSSVVAWGNSSVVARENSSVVAWENSSVEAWGNSSVVAWGNSSVEAWENSSVEAWGNSSVEAWGNSSVVARENSSVEAWGNSSVEAYQYAVVFAFSFLALRLFDWAVFRSKRKEQIAEINGPNVVKVNDFEAEEISFDTWLERGYVEADGITRKLVERSKDGEIDIFKVVDFKKKESFVVRKGNHFSHGETLPEARADLDYKLNGRDTSRFKKWKRDEPRPVGEMIVAYRAITGACAMGVKDFMKDVPNLPEAVSPEMVIGFIGDSYGAREFKSFFSAEGA